MRGIQLNVQAKRAATQWAFVSVPLPELDPDLVFALLGVCITPGQYTNQSSSKTGANKRKLQAGEGITACPLGCQSPQQHLNYKRVGDDHTCGGTLRFERARSQHWQVAGDEQRQSVWNIRTCVGGLVRAHGFLVLLVRIAVAPVHVPGVASVLDLQTSRAKAEFSHAWVYERWLEVFGGGWLVDRQQQNTRPHTRR